MSLRRESHVTQTRHLEPMDQRLSGKKRHVVVHSPGPSIGPHDAGSAAAAQGWARLTDRRGVGGISRAARLRRGRFRREAKTGGADLASHVLPEPDEEIVGLADVEASCFLAL